MARRVRAALNGRHHSESGFTLVEMIVALLILAIVLSASLYSVVQGLQLSRDSTERVVASTVVSKALETLHADALAATSFNSIPIGSSPATTQTIEGTTFTLKQDTEWVSRGTDTAACNSSSNQGLILRAVVTATWGINTGESVSEATLLSPPSGTFSSTDGSLGVSVVTALGAGYPGASVTVTPQSGTTGSPATSQTSGTDGCVFFTNLLPDTYYVTVSSATGIDNYEETTFNSNYSSVYYTTTSSYYTVSATAQSTQTVTVNYNDYGTVFWSYAPEYSNYSLTNYPPASGMPVSLDSSSLNWTYNMVSYPNPPTGSTVSGSINAYPTSYGSIFSGGCTDGDPNGSYPTGTSGTVQFYPGTTVQAPVAPTADNTSSVNLPVYPLVLQIQNTAGVAQPTAVTTGTAPQAVEGQTAGAINANVSCPDPATYTLSAVAAGVSNTSVGLGHYYITVSVKIGSTTESGSVSIWVKPTGVYLYSGGTWIDTPATGNGETFSGTGALSGSIPVQVH